MPAPVAVLATVMALAGCATTIDGTGTSVVGIGLFAFCEPAWTLPATPVDVPELRRPDRRAIEPSAADLPDLPQLRGVIPLVRDAADVAELAPAGRPMLVDRIYGAAPELPPSRGAQSLPATVVDVPTLAPPERRIIASAPIAAVELVASTRSIDLGVRPEPLTDELRACPAALATFPPPCTLSRADLRDPRWRIQ